MSKLAIVTISEKTAPDALRLVRRAMQRRPELSGVAATAMLIRLGWKAMLAEEMASMGGSPAVTGKAGPS